MPVTVVSDLKTFTEVISQDKYVVFDFWATWCGPCKVISPIFEKLSDQFPAVDFYKVDVDTASDVAAEVNIRAMPTFILFKNGEKVGELVGANPQKLNELIASAK